METMAIIFPLLSQVPKEVSVRLERMINCLAERNKEGALPRFNNANHIFEILDSVGKRLCLLKLFDNGDELSARKEAAAYLLDHPEDGHRSRSPNISGFCGVPPTVFVRFRTGGQSYMGVLVEFGQIVEKFDAKAVHNEELHKVHLVDLRFGITDRKKENFLAKLDENGIVRYVPIDNEYSFYNTTQRFHVPGIPWLQRNEELSEAAKIPFSPRFVTYVARLDPSADLAFLTRCGWVHGNDYAECLTIFTLFLKIGVSKGLTPLHLGEIATSRLEHNMAKYNLQKIVDSVETNEEFIKNVGIRIEERLTEYHGLL